MYFFEYIDEGRGERYPILHGETKSVRLSRLVIRILAEDNDLHFIERAVLKSVEHIRTGRINSTLAVFLFNEIGQLLEIIFFKLVG